MTTTTFGTLNPEELPLHNGGLDAPVIYAEDIRGTFGLHGLVKMNLVQNRVDALTSALTHVPVATLVIPAGQLRTWGQFMVATADEFDAIVAAQAAEEAAEKSDGEQA